MKETIMPDKGEIRNAERIEKVRRLIEDDAATPGEREAAAAALARLNGYPQPGKSRSNAPQRRSKHGLGVYLPHCRCNASWLIGSDSLDYDPDVVSMVRITTINGRAQVVLHCGRHYVVGNALPVALTTGPDGESIDPWSLPERPKPPAWPRWYPR
jgi:hypothetical protein